MYGGFGGGGGGGRGFGGRGGGTKSSIIQSTEITRDNKKQYHILYSIYHKPYTVYHIPYIENHISRIPYTIGRGGGASTANQRPALQDLPPNLKMMFEPRPPLEFKEPIIKPRCPPYTGYYLLLLYLLYIHYIHYISYCPLLHGELSK